MQLLLFLSALLAGLTGFSGDRLDARAVQQGSAAIARAADTAANIAVTVSATRRPVAPVAARRTTTPRFAIHDTPAGRPARLSSERRLE